MNLQRLHYPIQVTEVLSNAVSNMMAGVTGLHMLAMITLCTWQFNFSLSLKILQEITLEALLKPKWRGKKKNKQISCFLLIL